MNKAEQFNTCSEELRDYFLAELTLLKGLCKSELKGRAKEVVIVLASACSTGTAIHKIGESPEYFYSEMMMLARSFIEKITNFCYLQICDDNEYENFLFHPFYKMFHNSDKSKYTLKGAINIKFTGKEQMRKNPNIKKALEMFSDTNAKMNWSSLGIDQKVSVISQKTKIKTDFFLMNTLTIYSNASEALHGSLYGCALATGAYSQGINHQDHDEVYENLSKNTGLIYAQLGSIIDELIKLLLKYNQTNPLVMASRENQKIALDVMKRAFK